MRQVGMLERMWPSAVFVAATACGDDVGVCWSRAHRSAHATKQAFSKLRAHLRAGRAEALRSQGADRRACERSDSGFTLVELMIGLVIAGFLLTMALPSFPQFLRNSEIRSTTESIVNGLRLARSEAANRNQAVVFALAGGGNPSWSINLLSDGSLLQKYAKEEGGASAIVATLPANAFSVTFNGLGRIVPAGGVSPNLKQLDISSALSSNARALRIYVDDAHGVRTCDPSPALAALVPRDARAC